MPSAWDHPLGTLSTVISFNYALDYCVYIVYKYSVILAAMDYNMIMLVAIIHILNMLCSHVFNHDGMIKLTIYDNIIPTHPLRMAGEPCGTEPFSIYFADIYSLCSKKKIQF